MAAILSVAKYEKSCSTSKTYFSSYEYMLNYQVKMPFEGQFSISDNGNDIG